MTEDSSNNPTTITNAEFYGALEHMKTRINESKETDIRIENKIDNALDKIEQVLVQATKTNGRVNGLEDWRDKSNDTFQKISELCINLEKKIGKLNSKINVKTAMIVGGGAVLTLTGWFSLQYIVGQQNKEFQAQQKVEVRELIKDGIAQALRDNVHKVEVAK